MTVNKEVIRNRNQMKGFYLHKKKGLLVKLSHFPHC